MPADPSERLRAAVARIAVAAAWAEAAWQERSDYFAQDFAALLQAIERAKREADVA